MRATSSRTGNEKREDRDEEGGEKRSDDLGCERGGVEEHTGQKSAREQLNNVKYPPI